MSSKTLRATNKLVDDLSEVINLLSTEDGLSRLYPVTIDWQGLTITGLDKDLLSLLFSGDLVSDVGSPANLTPKGLSFFGKILVDLKSIAKLKEPIEGKYVVERLISLGKNSATFKVIHSVLGRSFVLKVVRPGSGMELKDALRRLGGVGDIPPLVQPLDYFTLTLPSILGALVPLQCLIFPYIDGKTLREFLAESPPLSPYFISALIEQLSRALAALEKIGAYHGDLHGDNILVRQPKQGHVTFFLIDISYGIGSSSEYRYEGDDFRYFQEHVWRSLVVLQEEIPEMSLRKHLGAKIYSVVEHILGSESLNFNGILAIVESNRLYREFVDARDKFIKDKFRTPSGLHLLRYEEFTDPTVAIELFEPFPALLNKISNFGNTLLYGHRGSGKSTYLAALACFPKVKNPIFDLREKFGVFFACRQGEFKQYAGNMIDRDEVSHRHFKHILVLKMIRRLVSSLGEAVGYKLIREASNYDPIYYFLERFVVYGELGAYDSLMVSPLENLHAGLLRNEILEIDALFGRKRRMADSDARLDEQSLLEFCVLVKGMFSDLSQTQFYFLFDDAGAPNVPPAAQRVLNETVRAINSTYCVKLSAERYSYIFADASGKVLEDPHDILVDDISSTLFLGSGNNPEKGEVDKYFRKILSKRLEYWNYRSQDIIDYIGDEVIPVDELVARLVSGRRDAYFAGWQVVWQLADRTVRNLLEVVNQIFARCDVSPNSNPRVVPARMQNGAVRSVSERKLRALSYIPGTISSYGDVSPLGKKLYEFTAAFGSIAQAYLKHGTKRRDSLVRFDERIAIERNDSEALVQPAQDFLEVLIRFGIMDDSHLDFARDDRMKKSLYILNRIFCPAFGISFRRDQHLRLSKGRFEQLLLDPIAFAREGTRFLRKFPISRVDEYVLF